VQTKFTETAQKYSGGFQPPSIMRKLSSFRRFAVVVLTVITSSLLMASCAASGPKYGCPGAVNQGSKYGRD
jgi:purine-cytosine permease-like protein